MRRGMVFILTILALGSLGLNTFAQDKVRLDKALLSAKTTDIDYNYTLHNPYLKSKVLQLADVLANAGLFTLNGKIRDHKKRAYLHISKHKSDPKTQQTQARKLIKMGRALIRTADDDYRLAGEILVHLGNDINIKDIKSAEFQVFMLEEFYRNDLTPPGDKNPKDDEQLRAMAEQVMGNVRGVFGQFSESVQAQAVDALNLQTVVGGMVRTNF